MKVFLNKGSPVHARRMVLTLDELGPYEIQSPLGVC
jgi:hypothetical protein